MLVSGVKLTHYRRLVLPHSKDFYERGVFGSGAAYRRGSATGALGMQNSPINDLIEDLFEEAARVAVKAQPNPQAQPAAEPAAGARARFQSF